MSKPKKRLDEVDTMRRLESLVMALAPTARHRVIHWLAQRIDDYEESAPSVRVVRECSETPEEL